MIKTINLDGTEQAVKFAGKHTHFHVHSLGGEVLVSLAPNVERGADGVLIVQGGGAGYVQVDIATDTVYLRGSGEVQIAATGNAFSPFKAGSKGGGEVTSEGGAIAGTVDYPIIALNLYGESVQDGTPTPEAPVDIVSVGDNGAVEVTACGKNLLPSAKAETKTLNGITVESYGGGSYHISGTATDTSVSIIFDLQSPTRLPQETIYLSLNNSAAAVNQASITFIADGTNVESVSFNEIDRKYKLSNVSGEKVTGLLFYVKSGATVDITCKPQLELNGYTDFEPYKGSATTITSGLPLCSVGDVCDELIYNADGTGKIIKRTAKKVLVADNIEAFYESENGNYFVTTVKGMSGENSDFAPVCSRFVGVSYNERTAEKYINTFRCYSAPDGKITLRSSASDNRFTSLAEMKEYVSANETVVVYPLATPQEIELTAGEMSVLMQLQTFNGTTNIYNDENAEMKVKVATNPLLAEYVKPVIDGITARFEARISALEAAVTNT